MDRWERFDSVASLLLDAKYDYSNDKSNGSYYCTKTLDDDTCESLKKYISENGRMDTICGNWYNFLQINGWKYWVCDNQVRKIVARDNAPYDYIADVYDGFFSDKESKQEDREVLEMIGYKDTDSVLDIGCGTGLFLDYENPRPDLYLGIDVSDGMLKKFNRRHGAYESINTGFEDFYSDKKYDLIIAMYGVFSYIDEQYLGKVVHYLKDNGRAFLMLYADDYHPVTYEMANVEFEHEKYSCDDLEGWNVRRYHGFNIMEYVKGGKA